MDIRDEIFTLVKLCCSDLLDQLLLDAVVWP